VCRQSVRQGSLVKFLQILKVFDVTMVTVFIAESRLAIDGRTICHVTLTKDPRICLCQVLRILDGGVSF
jgi:hypothetical protein